VTQVPVERLTLREALVLGRLRWQSALLFKLWKSHGRGDESRRTKPWRSLGAVSAKLLTLLVQHGGFLVSDGDSGATLQRPGLARRRARAALAAFAGGLLTAPARFARHDGHPMLWGDARTHRGGRVAGVERPMREAPHAQRL
jgi:hypothetical protein